MPFEAWFGRKPDIGHLRVFGCIVHMKVPKFQTGKLDDRSVKVINLGKEPGTKANLLYNPVKDKVRVSRDVVFEEDKRWEWDDQTEILRGDKDISSFVVPNMHDVRE